MSSLSYITDALRLQLRLRQTENNIWSLDYKKREEIRFSSNLKQTKNMLERCVKYIDKCSSMIIHN